ncbi:inositol 2-dehydrogenase [Neodiprion lecontei]|uniref:Inositol 2-dehydrogenase n=1 Tax=Neodiprion lecontei TaxID=441921 RepID=A0A6J0BP73_NEOLC|nr:inositol 2-dehydrogenase [Neodiprion lecontei]
MATTKFKEASPYVQPTPTPPPEDYLYKIYEDNVALKSSRTGEKVLNLAIFGLGRAGTIHLSSLARNPRVKITYVVDDVESKWAALKEFWGLNDATFLNSKQSSAVFKDPKVDVVVVASPTFTHEDIVVESLKAKKAVFCEKPIAESRENSVKCYETAKAVGKPLFCAFNRRFDPSYSAVRQRVQKGEVGHVQTIKVCSRDSPLPSIEYLRTSGGIFHDCMVHDIDMMTWIIGEYPIKVAVQAHTHIPEIKALDDHDTVAATLYFPSGTLGIVDLSRNCNYGYDQRLEVFGPKGMLTATNEQPIHCVETQYGLNGLTTAPIWYSFPSRYRNAYQTEMEHFLDIVHGKAQSIVDYRETLAVSKIATACEESARSGKMVEIKWGADELPKRN